jgi:MoaA/NifB/PqqE/SkfB family radical SAM enzyme
MYKLEDIRDIHLEITSKCQARCPMCPRRINGGVINPLIEVDEINLDKFKSWFPAPFIAQLDSLFMCGNLGDPIIAEDCLEIFQYLRKTNPNIRLSMHTNGSARNINWWKELATYKVRVTFGIDGLEDTHKLYRINTDWHKIIKNAHAFIEAGGEAEWHMLVFEHNEHQIEECRTIAADMKFNNFQIKNTTRFEKGKFNVLDDVGKTTHILYPTQKSKDMMSKVTGYITDLKPVITCKAQKGKNFYVSSCGKISPCCWLDFDWILPKQDTRIDYMDKIGVLPDLNDNSLSEIFNSGYFDKIAETWNNDSLMECSKQCGNFDKLGSQFEN